MKLILLLLSILCLIPNLDTPAELSNIGEIRIAFDWGLTISIAYCIVSYSLRDYTDVFKNRIYCIWLLGLILGELVLAYCWTPFLSPSSGHWGFDPQRYYYYMNTFITNGHFTDFSLNYRGILFFYLPFLLVFGLNPLVPFFVNSILMLSSVILFVKMCDVDIPKILLGLLFLFPEMIWFGVMSSREIPCLFALALSIYGYVRYVNTSRQADLYILCIGVVLMGVIRLPYMFILFLVLCVHVAFYSNYSGQKWLILIGGVLLLGIGMYLSSATGSASDQADLASRLGQQFSGGSKAVTDGYGERSVALLLIPHNPIEYVVYGIVRSFAYLCPSGNPFSFAYQNAYIAGQGVLVGWSSVIMVLTLPFVFSFVKQSLRNTVVYEQLLAIAFLVFWLFIGSSTTTMIHIRYRVVYDLVYAFIIVLYLCNNPKEKYLPLFYKWSLCLAFLGLFGFIYKVLL